MRPPTPKLQPTMRTTEQIKTDITERLGSVPAFFLPAEANPGVLENLWDQTRVSYLDSSLPSLLKEKLFAYLSRYCVSPYALVQHSCALRRLGMTSTDVLDLLERPAPRDAEIEECLRVLSAVPGRANFPSGPWPAANSVLEESILCCSIAVFLHHAMADRCHDTVRRLLGDSAYSQWVAFIAYIRTCHLWLEANESLASETDFAVQEVLVPLLKDEPRLESFFHTYSTVVREDRARGAYLRPGLYRSHTTSSLAAVIQNNGLVSVCAWCNRIRGGDGDWLQAEEVDDGPKELRLTHGICPSCEEVVSPPVAA